MLTSTRKLDSVQVLRAIAVLLVVYVHTIFPSVRLFGPSRQSSFFALTTWGCLGVDLFFVISGFIMTRIMHAYQGAGGWKVFALKRAVRIIPLYWGLSLVVGLVMLRTYPVNLVSVWKTVHFFPISETEFILPVIPAGWTLSYEIYFYLLFALVLRFRLQHPKAAIVLLLVTLSAIGYFVTTPALLPRFLTSPLLLEFALGVGCGRLYDAFQPANGWHRAGMYGAFTIGLLFVFVPLFWYYGDLTKPELVTNSNHLAFWRSIVWGIPCALLMLGYLLLERVYRLSGPALFVDLGDASYSNYLIHNSVIIYAYKPMLKLHLSTDAYIIVMVLICAVISYGVYRLIEKPLTDQLNAYLFPESRPVPAVAVTPFPVSLTTD